MALVDYVGATDGRPFLVETDTSVPDVFKTYSGEIGVELVNLDEREGWIELLNLVESHREDTIVINTGARNQSGISNFGTTLRKALPQLKRKLIVFWLIDRKRESLELLADFRRRCPRQPSTSSGTCTWAPSGSSSSTTPRICARPSNRQADGHSVFPSWRTG